MAVKERLSLYLKSRKISARSFCEVIGVSATYVSSMRSSIQPDKLNSITEHFPDLNITWLLTGDGQMLNNIESGSEVRNDVLSNQEIMSKLVMQNEKLIAILERHSRTIENLSIKINDVEGPPGKYVKGEKLSESGT
jgi:transcriptional regulator with XRE-family HTH domain